MPRIPPLLLRQTQASDGLLARLLPVCRELTVAQNELRWLREHATATKDDLHKLVLRRARGEPLQYILGTEYFGGLEIVCRPGVLIPRQETAASISYLVQQRLPRKQRLRVLDLCTGTGCIPLLFHHEYHKQYCGELNLIGIDVSDTALDLARQNHQRQLSARDSRTSAQSLQQLQFLKGDVLTGVGLPRGPFDILISNPPYVSQHDFKTVTASSVRQYEPKLALVPPPGDTTVADGDQFYPHLWRIADEVNASTVLFEIGDAAQAERVAQMGTKHHWDQIELWRDEPSKKSEHGLFQTIGEGSMRSVFARRLSSAG